jgi:hypothetical protein
MKGLVIQLSPEVAQSLRQGTQRAQAQLEEDWDDVLPLQTATPDGSRSMGRLSVVEEANHHDDNDNSDRRQRAQWNPAPVAPSYDEEEDQDSVASSGTPPPSMPALLVDLEKLVGYLPESGAEIQRLSGEVAAALGAVGDEGFEARVTEMFGSRIARHTVTPTATTTTTLATSLDDTANASSMDSEGPSALRYLTLPYPDTVVLPGDPDDPEQRTVVSTARLWKRLLRPPPVPAEAVGRLLGLLAGCDRALTWKASMRREILRLARDEERRAEIADHDFHRPDQLRQLYAVRAALEQQVRRTADRVSDLERERDELVAQRLELQRLQEGRGDASDFLASGMFSSTFPPDEDEAHENGVGLLSDYGDAIGEEGDADDYDNGSEVEGESEDSDEDDARSVASELEDSEDGGAPSQDSTADSTQPSATPNPVNRSGRRSRSGRRRRARRRQQQEMIRAKQLEAAKARRDREAMQRACTTAELTSQQAVLFALDRRLRQVDELIETLQEEEWKDEEEREGRGGSDDDESNGERADDPVRQGELSVLDEILAMIIGATSSPLDNPTMEADLAWVQAEHRSIVKQWKEHFGCLPPPLRRQDDSAQGVAVATSEKPPVQQLQQPHEENLGDSGASLKEVGPPEENVQERLRKSFGIENRDVDHWEEEDEEEDDMTAKEEAKVLSLRPRGRASKR